jgi:hypothetical protein
VTPERQPFGISIHNGWRGVARAKARSSPNWRKDEPRSGIELKIMPASSPVYCSRIVNEHLHKLLTRRLTPAEAVATGAVTIDGDAPALPLLVELFAFPALDLPHPEGGP